MKLFGGEKASLVTKGVVLQTSVLIMSLPVINFKLNRSQYVKARNYIATLALTIQLERYYIFCYSSKVIIQRS